TKGPDGKKEEPTLVKSMTVQIVPGRGMTSQPILRGVFTRPRAPAQEPAEGDGDGGTRVRDLPSNPAKPPKHEWVIDDESPSIEVQDAGAVTVLMRSDDLAAVTGNDGAVAVSFRVGKGTPRTSERGRPTTGGTLE